MLPAVALLLRPILAAGVRRAVGGAVVKSAAKRELGKTLGKRAAGEAARAFASKPQLGPGDAAKAAKTFAQAAKSSTEREPGRRPAGSRFKLDLSGIKNLIGAAKPAPPRQSAGSAVQHRAAKLASAFSKNAPTLAKPPAPPQALKTTQAFPAASTPGQHATPFPSGSSRQPPQPPGFPTAIPIARSVPSPFSRGAAPIARPVSSMPAGGPPGHVPSGPPPATGESKRSFSGLAAKNFGDLLSGKKTPEQVNAKADQDEREATQKNQKEHDDAARKEATDQLKNLGKAALGGITGLIAMPAIAKKFTEALVSSQQGLKRFNGQIGIAFAKLERGDIRRQQQSGARTSGTLVPLVDAVNKMKDETQKLSDVAMNAFNSIATPLARGITQLVAGVNYIAEGLGFQKQQPAQMGPWQRHIVRMGDRFAQNARNNRFVPPAQGPAGGARGGARGGGAGGGGGF